MRRPIRGSVGPSKNRYGTPVGRPEPQGIDPWSGFKVPLSQFVRQWDNQLVWDKNCDTRNPQDYVRGIKENMSLPFARPEAPDTFVALNILWQNDALMTSQLGAPLLTQGIDPADTL